MLALADKVIDDKELEKVLINDNCVYKQKCKLGFQVEKNHEKIWNSKGESKIRIQRGAGPIP